jgi:bifunctional DNase/RNase
MSIDSRPSDAIALALRTGSPIYVNSDVIDKAKNSDMTKDAGESERIRKWLDSLDPDELGKYKM